MVLPGSVFLVFLGSRFLWNVWWKSELVSFSRQWELVQSYMQVLTSTYISVEAPIFSHLWPPSTSLPGFVRRLMALGDNGSVPGLCVYGSFTGTGSLALAQGPMPATLGLVFMHFYRGLFCSLLPRPSRRGSMWSLMLPSEVGRISVFCVFINLVIFTFVLSAHGWALGTSTHHFL